MRKIQDFEKISNIQTNLWPKIEIFAKKVTKNGISSFSKKNYYSENLEKTLLAILSTTDRKSNNIIDFMNCHRSQLNVNYKYWLIKWLFFMWAYGWKKTVCFGWHCIDIILKFKAPNFPCWQNKRVVEIFKQFSVVLYLIFHTYFIIVPIWLFIWNRKPSIGLTLIVFWEKATATRGFT